MNGPPGPQAPPEARLFKGDLAFGSGGASPELLNRHCKGRNGHWRAVWTCGKTEKVPDGREDEVICGIADPSPEHHPGRKVAFSVPASPFSTPARRPVCSGEWDEHRLWRLGCGRLRSLKGGSMCNPSLSPVLMGGDRDKGNMHSEKRLAQKGAWNENVRDNFRCGKG